MIDEKKLIEELENIYKNFDLSYASTDVQNVATVLNEETLNTVNEQPQIDNWISCKDRLPEKCETDIYDMQLVTLDNGEVCLGVYRNDDKEWLTRMSEGEKIYSNKHKVIAWQSLPEAYHE